MFKPTIINKDALDFLRLGKDAGFCECVFAFLQI